MMRCKSCDEPLVLQIEDEVEDGPAQDTKSESIPDDLTLTCGCHFHWQCLLDESSTIAMSLRCPGCDTLLPRNEPGPSTANQFLQTSPGAVILAQYTNEGGIQHDLDILPSITEEAYLQNHPEARPARAMHIMCSEGDVGGIVELLHDANDQSADLQALILYQDPLSSMQSGLHLAIAKGQEEVVWLLLWLSSTLSTDTFPIPARQVAESLGVGRQSVDADRDIRSLKDDHGRLAENVAQQLSGQWSSLLDTGVLSPQLSHIIR